jgi:hypothetical protein
MKGTKIVIMPIKDDIQSLRRPMRSAKKAPTMEEIRLTMFKPPLIPVLYDQRLILSIIVAEDVCMRTYC